VLQRKTSLFRESLLCASGSSSGCATLRAGAHILSEFQKEIVFRKERWCTCHEASPCPLAKCMAEVLETLNFANGSALHFSGISVSLAIIWGRSPTWSNDEHSVTVAPAFSRPLFFFFEERVSKCSFSLFSIGSLWSQNCHGWCAGRSSTIYYGMVRVHCIIKFLSDQHFRLFFLAIVLHPLLMASQTLDTSPTLQIG